MQTIITDLRTHALISSNSVDILESCAGGTPDLLKRQKAKLQNQTLPTTYSPKLRSFALTLHFCSPRAYKSEGSEESFGYLSPTSEDNQE